MPESRKFFLAFPCLNPAPFKRFLTILCLFLLCFSQCQVFCFANDLDLSSTNQTVTAGNSGTIDNGGQTLTITAGSQITPAQSVALMQVLAGGTQTIQLDVSGSAVGGTLDIGGLGLVGNISNLVIPVGVTAIQDFSNTSGLNISGAINNSGTLYAISSNADSLSATIGAGSLFNNGLITSCLPDGGLSGYSNLLGGLNLTLNIFNDFINSGVISSSGNLAINAGSIMNTGTLSAVNDLSMSAASIANMGSIMSQSGNLAIGTDSLINNGLIQATVGDLVMRDLLGDSLKIDNTLGVLHAGHDIIANLLSANNNTESLLSTLGGEYTAGHDIKFNAGAGDITLTGGDYFSQQLSLQALQGNAEVNVGELTGTLSINADVAHVAADTQTLTLGDNCITGDPTYVSTGNININGVVTSNQAISIVAQGNISISSAATARITTTGNNAGNIVLIAGATLVACPGCTDSSGLPTGAVPIGGTATVDFSNPANVGNIDLSTNNTAPSGTIISSASTTGTNGNGGSVTLVAHGGYVTLPSSLTSINTSGRGTGNGGAVTIIANGVDGSSNAVSTGAITTGIAANTTGGSVTINTAAPTTAGLSFDANGNMTGTISTGTVNSAAGMSVGAITTQGGAVNLTAGDTLTTGNIVTTHGATGGVITATAGGTLTTGAITSPTQTASLTSTGGTINISSTGINSSTTSLNLTTGGGASNITATSGQLRFSDITVSGGALNLNATGAIATGVISNPGQATSVSSSGGSVDISIPGGTTLQSGGTTLVLSTPSGRDATVNVAGNVALGDGAIVKNGAGDLYLTATGTVDFRPAILADGTPIFSNGGIAVQGNTIDFSSSGTITFNSVGDLLSTAGFSVGVRFDAPNAGGGGIIFPTGGALTMNFTGGTGSGVEFDSNRSTDSFPGINSCALTINSQGDVHIAGEVVNQSGGSITVTLPTPASTYYTFQIDSVTNTAVAFSDIAVYNGALVIVSDGIITLDGNITIGGTANQQGNIIFIESGFDYTYGVAPPTFTNTQVGIVVSPGAIISANPGYVILSVVNVQTSPPANPAQPVITISSSAQVLANGDFVNGTTGAQNGGGIQISVNSPPGMTSLVSTLENQRPTLVISQNSGTLTYIDSTGTSTSVTESPTISQVTAGGVTLSAEMAGMVQYANGGASSPTLLSGTGTIHSNGGLVIVGGASYNSEIVVNGSVIGTVPAILAAPPVPPLPVPPPLPDTGVIVVPPVTAESGSAPSQNTILLSDNVMVPIAASLAATPQQITQQTQTVPIVAGVDSRFQVARPCEVFSILPATKLRDDKFAKYRGEAPVIMTFAGTTLKAEEPSEQDLKNGFMTLTVQEGRILVIGGSFNLIVKNKFGNRIATIPPGSTVAVEVKGNGAFSVGNLADQAIQTANSKLPAPQLPSLGIASANGVLAKEVTIAAGTSEIASNDDEEELIPTDGLSGARIDAKLTLLDDKVTLKNRAIVDKQKYMARESRITCNMIDNQSADRDLRRMRAKLKELNLLAEDNVDVEKGKVLKTQNLPSDQQIISAVLLTPVHEEVEKNPYQAVAFQTSVLPPAGAGLNRPALISKSCAAGTLRALPNTEFSTMANGTIELKSGDLLVDTRSGAQKITAGNVTMDITAGSIALISRKNDLVEVCNLWEAPSRSITVHANGSTIALSAGQEALFVNKKGSVSAALHESNYGRRANKVTELSDGSSLITGDVSLHSVLYVNKLLHRLAVSPNKVDQHIADRVIKMTAVLTIATAGRGRFEFVSH